jgi:hypothetical protein
MPNPTFSRSCRTLTRPTPRPMIAYPPHSFPMGINCWGNLGHHVALRRIPQVTGIVVSDLGPTWCIAFAEDGYYTVSCYRRWVGVNSPAHIEALEKLRSCV